MKFTVTLLACAAWVLPALAADQTQIFSTQANAVRITPIYHATAQIIEGRDTIYIDPAKHFAGDTEGTPEMRALKDIDVAFIPMNLPYTMTPAEAADAVKAFHPKVAIPYHYKGQDIAVFKKALEGSGTQVRLLDWYPGDAK